MEVLEKNPYTFFSATEIAHLTSTNKLNCIKTLKKMEVDTYINYKTIITGRTNQPTKIYAYTPKNAILEQAYKEFNEIVTDRRFIGWNADTKLLFLIYKEIRGLKKNEN